MAAMPYRLADVPEPSVVPPGELAYVATLVEDAMVPHRVVHQFLAAAPIVIALGVWVSGLLGLCVGIAAIAAIYLSQKRREANAGRVLLRASNGTIEVMRGVRRTLLVRSSLEELAAVKLDSETQKAFAIHGHGVRAAELPATGNRARIVLVFADRREVPLTEVYLTHSDCVEWIPKIRRFLRSHGWLPEDEREAASLANAR